MSITVKNLIDTFASDGSASRRKHLTRARSGLRRISRLFEAGWSIPQVQAVTGHRKWSTLQTYTHVTPQHVLELEI